MNHESTATMQSPWGPLENTGDHPILVGVAALVFTAGLVIDVWILLTLFRRRGAVPQASFFQITAKPWGLAEIGFIVITLCGLLLVASVILNALERAGALRDESLRQAQLLTSGIVFDGFGMISVFMLLRTARVKA